MSGVTRHPRLPARRPTPEPPRVPWLLLLAAVALTLAVVGSGVAR